MCAVSNSFPSLDAAIEVLRAEKLVAYPTETVWGIAARVRSEPAVSRLQRLKGRDREQPISILISGPSVLDGLEFEVPPLAERLIARFWPGPLTLVLPCSEDFAPGIAREDGAVGVRCSAHPAAQALARRAECEGLAPLTSTSLNRSGEPSAMTPAAAEALCVKSAGELFGFGLDATWEGGGDARGSTVVDLSGASPEVLRWGAIEPESLEPALAGTSG